MYRYPTITATVIAMLFLASVEGRSENLLDRFKYEKENVYDKTKAIQSGHDKQHDNQNQQRRLRKSKLYRRDAGKGGGKGSEKGSTQKHSYTLEELNSKLKGTLMEELFRHDEEEDFFARAGDGNLSMPSDQVRYQVAHCLRVGCPVSDDVVLRSHIPLARILIFFAVEPECPIIAHKSNFTWHNPHESDNPNFTNEPHGSNQSNLTNESH